MQLVNECCEKVKKDYLKFLKKEKIFNKSKATKITSLKKTYIPMSFWIEDKYKKKELQISHSLQVLYPITEPIMLIGEVVG